MRQALLLLHKPNNELRVKEKAGCCGGGSGAGGAAAGQVAQASDIWWVLSCAMGCIHCSVP